SKTTASHPAIAAAQAAPISHPATATDTIAASQAAIIGQAATITNTTAVADPVTATKSATVARAIIVETAKITPAIGAAQFSAAILIAQALVAIVGATPVIGIMLPVLAAADIVDVVEV